MPTTINLYHDDLHCQIAPALGGSVLGLYKGGEPVLAPAPTTGPRSGLDAASYPLVPYSNRIGYAHLAWEGHIYALQQNFLPEPHCIHGTGWQSVWAVSNQTQSAVDLHMHHQPNAFWPFEFAAHQHLSLGPQGLTLVMSITNMEKRSVPVGLGWHPYFVKRPDTTIAFVAGGRWEMGADKLPTECLPNPGLSGPIDQLTVDHCFEEWLGALELKDAVFRVKVQSDFDRLVVYTHPALDRIAVEPVSHVNNAFNRVLYDGTGDSVLQQGVRRLPPGGQFGGKMQINVVRTH